MIKGALLAITTLAAALVVAPANAADACLVRAALEFHIPPAVLDGMRQDYTPPTNPELAAREFGPMGLVSEALVVAQKGAGIDAARAKLNACENYRAAAWFLADKRRAAGGDLWEGVARYYGGDRRSASRDAAVAPVVARLKKLSGDL